MLRLEVRHKTKGTFFFESDKTSVFLGRDRSMDLVLDDPLVSRQHAVIIARGADFVLQDIGGRNPLRVNDAEVLSHVLLPGDVIELGETSLVFDQSRVGDGRRREDAGPTIVDARLGFEHFVQSGECVPAEIDDTATAGSQRRLPAGETRSRKSLRILQSFSELVRSLSERKRLLEAALHTVFDNLEVLRGFIGFFSPDGSLEISVERSHTGRRVGSYSRSIVDRVRKEAVAILFSDSSEDGSASSPLLESRSIVKLNIKSAMCLPIFRGDNVCGAIYLDNREKAESFSTEDLYFANILAHLISLAIEKEDLYDRIRQENLELKSILGEQNKLIGVSDAFKGLLRKLKKVAAFDTTVLILGESGTGKELVARAIHERSPRSAGPFVAVNCAAIPETLLESELFGYAPMSGISGGDPKGRAGKFELAHTGTLFLDEIGDMTVSTQAKILRVLEDRMVFRIGAAEGVRVDLRIVAATNKDLEKAVASGAFREDLFYRLKVFQLETLPLRDRPDDILALSKHFLSRYDREGKPPLELSPRAKELVLTHSWPGNIRELKNCMEEAALLSNGRTIYPENLPRSLRREEGEAPFETLERVEAEHISKVLRSVNWNKSRAAEILGINRSTLYEKIRSYRLERPREDGVEPDPGEVA